MPIFVLLLFIVLKVVCRDVFTWLKFIFEFFMQVKISDIQKIKQKCFSGDKAPYGWLIKFKIIKLLTQWFWGKIQGKKNIQLFKSFCSFSNTKNFWKIYVQTKVWSLIKFLIYLAEFYTFVSCTARNMLMWNVKPVCIKTSSLHFFAGSHHFVVDIAKFFVAAYIFIGGVMDRSLV